MNGSAADEEVFGPDHAPLTGYRWNVSEDLFQDIDFVHLLRLWSFSRTEKS